MDPLLIEIQKEWHGTLKSYLYGFLISALLTGASYYLVWSQTITGQTLIISVVFLGLLQAVAQLRFFLHLGEETKPRFELIVFSFMVLVLLIIALGSLWIMHDLDDRMMPSQKEMTHD